MKPAKKETSCGAVIFRVKKGKLEFLLVKKDASAGGHWSYAKGHMEGNETEEQTALREIKEETNLDVELLKQFKETISYSPKPDVDKAVILFLARPLTEDVKVDGLEIKEASWLDYAAAIRTLTFPEGKDVLKKAFDFLNENEIIE